MSTILKFLAMWTMVSIAAGLVFAPVMRWGHIHYDPPAPQPLVPMPSGSIDHEVHG